MQVLKSDDAGVQGGYQVLARSGPGYEWGALLDNKGGPVYKLDPDTGAKLTNVSEDA
jgi:hypothetical protein